MQYSERYLKEFHRQKASAMENRFPTTGRLNLFEIMLVGLSCCGSLLSPPQLKKLASIEIPFDYDSNDPRIFVPELCEFLLRSELCYLAFVYSSQVTGTRATWFKLRSNKVEILSTRDFSNSKRTARSLDNFQFTNINALNRFDLS